MIGINTKKIVTLTVIGTFCLLALGDFYVNHNIDAGFSAMASGIVAFYFGKGMDTKDPL